MSAMVTQQPAPSSARLEELAKIIMAYSEVTEKLQQSHDHLQRTVEGLREELSEKNRQLERRNRLAALGEMAAGMAHEIRNPLGAIQLYASLLARDVAEQTNALDLVQKISRGVKRLESIVSQVLQFTREMQTNLVEMDLSDVVDQAVEMARPSLDANGVNCRISGPRPMPMIGDPLLLGQTILNLLLNASEALSDRSDGMIEVRYGRPAEGDEARQLHLVVRDNGPGIGQSMLDRVFNPFFTTKETGTGLGLAIVHRVIEAHDGSILVANNEEGGARFEIRI